jgi:hypothetical protein
VIDLLIMLMVPALRFLDNPRGNAWLFWAPLPAWLIDIAIAHTTWALIAGFPRIGEVTVSDTLERLCADTEHPDHALFWQIALKINRASGLPHIKAVTK